MTLLETITLSLADALAAEASGADRFELCSAIPLGGLTPSLGTLRQIKSQCRTPVMCMIRPRQGGMAYVRPDYQVMQADAELALETGADGLVFGFLSEEGEVDAKRCRAFRRLAEQASRIRPVETVFHRAFDLVKDQSRALEQLVDLGISRILTSGGAPDAVQGEDQIRRLVELAKGRIEILPGGGINESNVQQIVARTGAAQVHLYLPTLRKDRSVLRNPAIYFGTDRNELEYPVVDGSRVRAVRLKLNDKPVRDSRGNGGSS